MVVLVAQIGNNNEEGGTGNYLHPETFTSVGGVKLTASETGVVAVSGAIFGTMAVLVAMMLCASQILEREPKRPEPMFQRSSSEFA